LCLFEKGAAVLPLPLFLKENGKKGKREKKKKHKGKEER